MNRDMLRTVDRELKRTKAEHRREFELGLMREHRETRTFTALAKGREPARNYATLERHRKDFYRGLAREGQETRMFARLARKLEPSRDNPEYRRRMAEDRKFVNEALDRKVAPQDIAEALGKRYAERVRKPGGHGPGFTLDPNYVVGKVMLERSKPIENASELAGRMRVWTEAVAQLKPGDRRLLERKFGLEEAPKHHDNS